MICWGVAEMVWGLPRWTGFILPLYGTWMIADVLLSQRKKTN